MTHSIAVITSCLNAAATLEECILSVSGQTVLAEHIVMDGGSMDGTAAILQRNSGRISRFVSEPDHGQYDALNKGIRLANPDIIGILHADDSFSDEHVLNDIVNAFTDSAVDAVYADLDYVDRENPTKVVRHWVSGPFDRRKVHQGWIPPHPTFFVRKRFFDEFGDYRLDMGTAADYELMLRFILIHDLNLKYIPRVLVKMKTGGASNASLSARWAANRMDRKAWAVNGLKPYPWTLIAKPLRKVGQWLPR